MEVSARWNATETFLLRDLTVTRGGAAAFRVAQRIGWDPLGHKLKSWIFDSDGGYGEGTWSKDGDSWVIQTAGVLPDGRQTSSVHLITRDGEDGFTWKRVDGKVGGEPSADAELRFARKPATR